MWDRISGAGTVSIHTMTKLLALALVCIASAVGATPKAAHDQTPTADAVTARLLPTHLVRGGKMRVFVLLGDAAPAGTKLTRIGREYDARLPGTRLFAELEIGTRTFIIVGDAATWRDHLRAIAL